MGLGALLSLGASWTGQRLKSLSPRAWLILAGICVAIVLVVLHQRHAAEQILRAERRGAEAEARRTIARVNALTIKINQVAVKAREKQHARLGSIAADVHDLGLRGPGRAACTPQLPAARGSSRSQPAPGLPAAAVDPLPGGAGTSFIAMPFQPTLSAAGQCDANLDEVIRWRGWFQDLQAVH